MRSKFLILILLSYLHVSCQPITINGKIITEEGLPVSGATITLKRTHQSTSANKDGQFTLRDSRLTDTITISATGFETITMDLSKDLGNPTLAFDRPVTITLKRISKELGEVIVSTGFQNLSRERSPGSFEKIDAELFNRGVSSDVISRLEGVSGVYFDKRVNTLSPDFTIRGQSTIFANADPLIVIDNFPYDGNINSINPNDVESITILKDAAAASVWGVRAGNGVIVITTKKGKYRKEPRLEFNFNITVSGKPDLFYEPAMSSSSFINVETFLFGQGFYNGDISNTTTRPLLSPVVEILVKRRAGQISAADSASQIDALRGLDVRNDLLKYFYRNPLTQQYALSYNGGTSGMNYYLSAGFDKSLSNLVRNNTDRITFNSALSFTPSKFLEFGISAVYAATGTLSGNPGNNIPIGGSKFLYPYAQLADANGNALPVVRDYRYSYIDTVGGGKLLDWKYRPLQELSEANYNSNLSDIRLDLNATLRFNQHFSTSILGRFEKQAIEAKNLYSTNTYMVRNLVNRFYNPSTGKYGVPPGGIMDRTNSSILSYSGRIQTDYHQSWSTLHDVIAIAGAEIKEARSASEQYRVYGYDDNVLTYSSVNLVDNLPVYGGLSGALLVPNPQNFSGGETRLVSFYTNAAYTYDKKYTASFSARKDASNLFGVSSNQKWVPLWSSGLSWQVNKEKFYKSNLLPILRLRLTYGYNGNMDNSLSALTTIRYTSLALFTSQQYATIQNPPNPELRWEKVAVFNAGIDFSFKNDRVSGSVEYYTKTGIDLIGTSPVDPTTGVLSSLLGAFVFKGNVANMKGRGIDLLVNTRNLVGRIKWSSSLLFNYSDSRVTKYVLDKLNASTFLGFGSSINPIPGKPLYTIYSFVWAGLDPATGDPRGYLNGAISKDYTALTAVTVDKLNYHGSAIPVFFGALRNTISWRSFSVSANITYKLGYYFKKESISYSSLFNNWQGHSDYEKRWQKPGDEKFTDVPSFVYPNPTSNRDFFYNSSSVLVQRGDHIRLQDISLSYDIGKIKKNWPFKGLRVYSYMNNIGILWRANKSGLDPDYFNGGYPPAFSMSFGIKMII